MSWTKRQLVAAAFEEIGVANYVFDLDAEQIEGALRRLDSMLATWNGRGVRIGYALATDPAQSDLDQPAGVPDYATEAIYTNLAVRLAPTIGKVVSPDTKATAKAAYNALLSRVVAENVREQQFPNTLPAGQGNKPWRTDEVYLPGPVAPLTTGPDSTLDFVP